MESTNISLKDIRLNTGQIPGLPKNPRIKRDDRFRKLVKSIKDDPEMMELRELIVFPFNDIFVVIAGNRRFEALQELKYNEAPYKVIPKGTPVNKLKAITIKDNVSFGEDDWDALTDDWDTKDLIDWGMDIDENDKEVEPVKEVLLNPFKQTHFLFSFHPSVFPKIKYLLDELINFEGVDHEQASN